MQWWGQRISCPFEKKEKKSAHTDQTWWPLYEDLALPPLADTSTATDQMEVTYTQDEKYFQGSNI